MLIWRTWWYYSISIGTPPLGSLIIFSNNSTLHQNKVWHLRLTGTRKWKDGGAWWQFRYYSFIINYFIRYIFEKWFDLPFQKHLIVFCYWPLELPHRIKSIIFFFIWGEQVKSSGVFSPPGRAFLGSALGTSGAGWFCKKAAVSRNHIKQLNWDGKHGYSRHYGQDQRSQVGGIVLSYCQHYRNICRVFIRSMWSEGQLSSLNLIKIIPHINNMFSFLRWKDCKTISFIILFSL